MPDVIEQLRSYGDAAEAAVPPAAVREPRNRRPLLVAAAVLVVAAGAATAVWALRSTGDGPTPAVDTVEETGEPVGWQTLDPGPLAPREASALVWTGDEFVVWGGAREQSTDGYDDGAAFDPETATWRPMSASPLPGSPAIGVWTGEEVLLWSPSSAWQGAAWNPETDTWRVLQTGPARLDPELYSDDGLIEPVWTGEEMVDVAVGAAYDPATDGWRDLPERPIAGAVLATTWTGDAVVSLVANRSDAGYPAGEAVAVAYSPADDAWQTLPPTGVGEIGVDLAWDGERLVAVDYEMQGATHVPGAGRWASLPPLPFRFGECSPSIAPVADIVMVTHCSGYAVLDDRDHWVIAPPTEQPATSLIAAEDRAFSWWSSDESSNFPDAPVTYLQSYVPPTRQSDDLALERTIPVGTVQLDLAEDEQLIDTARQEEGTITTLGFVLSLGGGPECRLESTYAPFPSEGRIRNQATAAGATVEPFPLEGVDIDRDQALIARFVPGDLDDQAHILVEESTSDVLDITCPDLATATTLLERIHR